jgi:tetratricopeptide (TPR) repeat protein
VALIAMAVGQSNERSAGSPCSATRIWFEVSAARGSNRRVKLRRTADENGRFGGSDRENLLREILALPEEKLSPEEAARDLVYDAMEEPLDDVREKLLGTALKLDPENVDALLMSLSDAIAGVAQRIEALRAIVEIGERRLGPKAFDEFAGHFWGFIETRPYMRARQELADTLFFFGRLEKACVEYDEMLRLNPGDNQGVRYNLLLARLALGDLEKARKLIAIYPEEDWSVAFAWGAVLERFLSGDEVAAHAALLRARKQNPHMEAHLSGRRKAPPVPPAYYSKGSREEADCFFDSMKVAWEKHPQALAWLKKQKAAKKK